MEVFFCTFIRFFQKATQKEQRAAQKTRRLPGGGAPEGPQGPQQRRARQQVKRRAQEHVGQGVQPHLAAAQTHGEGAQRQGAQQHEHAVQQVRGRRAAQTHPAQQVVHRRQGAAGSQGDEQQLQLLGNVVFHPTRTGGRRRSQSAAGRRPHR